jgi:hypothetical protein
MKKEYNFSKGVRGKFYKANLQMNVPVYLNPDNKHFVEELARKKRTDLSSVVNTLIKNDRELAKVLN